MGVGSSINELNTSVIGSPTNNPYTFTSNSSTVMNPNLLNVYNSTSRNQGSAVYPNVSNYSSSFGNYGSNKRKHDNYWKKNNPFFYDMSTPNISTTSTTSANQTANLFESFMNSFIMTNSKKNNGIEGLETLSPPPINQFNFMPKSESVPPVCPSIPPVIIKQKCDPCPACAPCKNAPTNLPPPNSQGVSYDNLPMPNLPSFKGFGM